MAGPRREPSTPSASPPLRLNKALAGAGVCSRRGADELIRAGRVTLNGRVAGLGDAVAPGDDLRLDGKPVSLAAQAEDHLYFMLNKPVEVVTTARDPQGRRTVLDLMGEAARGRRLFPVGRLDYFSQGLLILTTDGEMANRLMHPSWHQPKRYRVTLREFPSAQALAAMEKGMTLAEGERLAPVRTRVASRTQGGGCVLEMELVQGVNRQIRRMCRDLGLTILKLERVSQGPLALGELKTGASRPLTAQEVAQLKASVGL